MQHAVTDAVAYQRELAIEEHTQSRQAIETAGCEIVELMPAEHDAFAAAIQPLLADAHKIYGEAMFKMLPKA
jgi:TRAP-type C4-dicarboxylate transport system substrate-binding protein